jgi:hypothetical protein
MMIYNKSILTIIVSKEVILSSLTAALEARKASTAEEN